MHVSFKLDHNKSRIRQRNLVFVPFIAFHFSTRWSSAWIPLALPSVIQVGACAVVPWLRGDLKPWHSLLPWALGLTSDVFMSHPFPA